MSDPVQMQAQAAPQAQGLQLRHDEVISGGFVLQTILALVVLLGGLALLLKWLSGRFPNRLAPASMKRITVLETLRLSARTRIVLLELDGIKASVIETPQGASLQFLPLSEQSSTGAQTGFGQASIATDGRK